MARPPRIRNRAVRRWVRSLAQDRRGGTAIEYGLILAVVFMAMMGALMGVADVTTNMWNDVSSKVQTAR
jgi:pilus assembly protein Flp/PilA